MDSNSKHRKYKKHRHPGIRPWKKTNSYIIDYIDHNGQRRQKTFYGTESEAVRARREILAKVSRIKAGIEAPPELKKSVLTFRDLWSEFEDEKRLKISSGSLSQRTLERYEDSYNAFVEYNPNIENKPIDKINPSDLEKFKVYRRKIGITDEGINTDLRSLRTIFNYAVKMRLLYRSPLKDVKFVSIDRSDVRFLDDSELNTLDKILKKTNFSDTFQRDAHDLVLFYLFTGARESEALLPSFKWDCIGKNYIRFPKTKSLKGRTIPKLGIVDDILRSRYNIKEGPFPFSKDQVYKRVKYMVNKAQLRDVSPHTLRKTAGAWYYMATRDIFATSKFLGHSSVSVTEKHYAGLIQSLELEYSQMFENTLKSNLQLICNLQTKPDQYRPITKKRKIPKSRREIGDLDGGPPGIRTPNRRIMSPAL